MASQVHISNHRDKWGGLFRTAWSLIFQLLGSQVTLFQGNSIPSPSNDRLGITENRAARERVYVTIWTVWESWGTVRNQYFHHLDGLGISENRWKPENGYLSPLATWESLTTGEPGEITGFWEGIYGPNNTVSFPAVHLLVNTRTCLFDILSPIVRPPCDKSGPTIIPRHTSIITTYILNYKHWIYTINLNWGESSLSVPGAHSTIDVYKLSLGADWCLCPFYGHSWGPKFLLMGTQPNTFPWGPISSNTPPPSADAH